MKTQELWMKHPEYGSALLPIDRISGKNFDVIIYQHTSWFNIFDVIILLFLSLNSGQSFMLMQIWHGCL